MSYKVPLAIKHVAELDKLRVLHTDGTLLWEQDKFSGKTALHIAAAEGHFDSLKFLVDRYLENGPKPGVDPQCKYGTPLSIAARNIQNRCACYLVIKGANVNLACDMMQYSALRWAEEKENMELLPILKAASRGNLIPAIKFLESAHEGPFVFFRHLLLSSNIAPPSSRLRALCEALPSSFTCESPSPHAVDEVFAVEGLDVLFPCPDVSAFSPNQKTKISLDDKTIQCKLRAILRPRELEIKRLVDEVRQLSGLDHPNVLKILALGQVHGLSHSLAYAVAAPRVDLTEINKLMNLSPKPTPTQVCTWIYQIICGVKYLADAPNNFMLPSLHRKGIYLNADVDGSLVAVITDLRHLQPLSIKLKDSSFIAEPDIIRYLAPEVIRCNVENLENAKRACSYNIGIIAYELLTQKGNWFGQNPCWTGMVAAFIQGKIKPNYADLFGFPDLQRAIQRMTSDGYRDRDDYDKLARDWTPIGGSMFLQAVKAANVTWGASDLARPPVSIGETEATFSELKKELDGSIPVVSLDDFDFIQDERRRLGEGEYCIAYRATFKEKATFKGKDVCVKVPRKGSSREANKRQIAEANFLTKLARSGASRHIIKLVAVCFVDQGQQVWLLLEKAKETLARHLEMNQISVRSAFDFISQIVEGLLVAHRQDIVHSDLHGKNIMIMDDGTICLIDFNHSVGVMETPPSSKTDSISQDRAKLATHVKDIFDKVEDQSDSLKLDVEDLLSSVEKELESVPELLRELKRKHVLDAPSSSTSL